MIESVLDQVRRIAADIFDMPLERVTAESSPDTVETWDSLQHLNLVLALEQNFQLAFAPEEIEEMLTIKSVVTLINEKLKLRL
jgi:acyl carrier protein